MKTYHLDKKEIDGHLGSLFRAAFPSYRGAKYSIRQQETANLNSYWYGGSRDSYVAVELATGRAIGLPTNHPLFEARNGDRSNVKIPDGIGVVEHSIFCGKDMGLTMIINPSNAAKLLPERSADAVTPHMRRVLEMAASLKNTYGGRTDIRFHESGLSRADYDAAFSACQDAGFLRKNGSITPAGRNNRERQY